MKQRLVNTERDRRRTRGAIIAITPVETQTHPIDWDAELRRAERHAWDGPAMIDLPERLQRYDRGRKSMDILRRAAGFIAETLFVLISVGAAIGGIIATVMMAERIW